MFDLSDHSWESQPDLQQLRVVGCTQASDGIPALHRREAIRAAAWVISCCDVVQGLRVGIEHGVDETHRTLALIDALLIDVRDDRSHSRR